MTGLTNVMDNAPHIRPGSIKIGDFHVDGRFLIANLRLVLCGRTENLIPFVEPFGDEIGVEVYDSILDMRSLTVIAEQVADKLDSVAGRTLLKMASIGARQNRRWLPQVEFGSSILGLLDRHS